MAGDGSIPVAPTIFPFETQRSFAIRVADAFGGQRAARHDGEDQDPAASAVIAQPGCRRRRQDEPAGAMRDIAQKRSKVPRYFAVYACDGQSHANVYNR